MTTSTKALGRKVSKLGDALETIATELRGTLTVGAELSGTVSPFGEDMDVEITIRVKRSVSLKQSARYRARAMAEFAAHAWNDRCPHSVPNRGGFRVTKTKSCSGRVTTAIVRRGYEDLEGPMLPGQHRPLVLAERFYFACDHHADPKGDADVLAIVRLDKGHLRTIRANRDREHAERCARERANERALEERVKSFTDDELKATLDEVVAQHEWTAEDVCRREVRRRAKGAA